MATQENRIVQGHSGNIIDVAGLEIQHKKDKARTKANFTRSRNSILMLLEQQDLPSRREVKVACDKMDGCMDGESNLADVIVDSPLIRLLTALRFDPNTDPLSSFQQMGP